MEEERRVSRETCIELTVKVPLDSSLSATLAIAETQIAAMQMNDALFGSQLDDAELAGVAILADGRRLQVGEDKIREWVGT